MPAGRPPTGPKQVDNLPGDEEAKRRMRVILETISGEKSITEASEELGIGEARFHVIRKEALAAGVRELAPKPTGRPRKQVDPRSEESKHLRQQVAKLERALEAAELRAELAVALPSLVKPERAGAKKKPKRKPPQRSARSEAKKRRKKGKR